MESTIPLPSTGRLTVTLELTAINDKGATTFKNTLLLGEMKQSDTIMFELAIAEAIKKIGETDLERTMDKEAGNKNVVRG